MKLIRRTIRQLILEKFSQEDVEEKMSNDTRSRPSREKFGAHAKDIFRQQREADPKIDKFLNDLITIHWKPLKKEEFSAEIDDDLIIEPLKNTSSKDELSCSPYLPDASGNPIDIATKGWKSNDTTIGIQVEGWVSWLEHGDAQTGHGKWNKDKEKQPSGFNKQPRVTQMGRDRYKGNSMADVIQSEEDFRMVNVLSSYGDGEALVDNWEPVKIWYIDEFDEGYAQQSADLLSARFNKKILIAHVE